MVERVRGRSENINSRILKESDSSGHFWVAPFMMCLVQDLEVGSCRLLIFPTLECSSERALKGHQGSSSGAMSLCVYKKRCEKLFTLPLHSISSTAMMMSPLLTFPYPGPPASTPLTLTTPFGCLNQGKITSIELDTRSHTPTTQFGFGCLNQWEITSIELNTRSHTPTTPFGCQNATKFLTCLEGCRPRRRSPPASRASSSCPPETAPPPACPARYQYAPPSPCAHGAVQPSASLGGWYCNSRRHRPVGTRRAGISAFAEKTVRSPAASA